MQYMKNINQKRDKVIIAIISSNFFLLVSLGLPQGSILCPLFSVIYIHNLSNHIVPSKTSADKLNSDLKANLNGHS